MLRHSSEFDGMMRTMVIAGEACQATPAVLPNGFPTQSAINIVGRTHVCTDTALHTSIAFHIETFVCDEIFQEKTAEKPTVDSGPVPACQLEYSPVAMDDMRCDLFEVARGLLLLHLLLCGRVHIHKR